MSNETPRGKVRIYGCGGTGINLTSHYEAGSETEMEGLGIISTCYLDTSTANLSPNIPTEKVFLVEEKEGSGKIRTENRVEISRAVTPALQKFVPLDLNIVVFSGSGGTGSVFGPQLVGKLLSMGKPTVAVVVGGDECERSAVNTLNTIRSLEGVAKTNDGMAVMYYEHLKPTDKRSQIDDRAWFVITSLAYLFSRRNRELDLADLTNFLNFGPPVTSVSPQLAVLEVYRSNEDAESAKDITISAASLLPSPDATGITFHPEYSCTGYPTEQMPKGCESMHFITAIEPVHEMFKTLTKTVNEISSAKNTRTVRDSIVSDSAMDESGMVF